MFVNAKIKPSATTVGKNFFSGATFVLDPEFTCCDN